MENNVKKEENKEEIKKESRKKLSREVIVYLIFGVLTTVVGWAVYFAIMMVKPSPFCILDEIEAALDEVNVERLAQYIKRYSHGTQFIMITHRRGTMAAADRLYGVTMPEHGISKILMLDVNDISKKEGDDWNGIFG